MKKIKKGQMKRRINDRKSRQAENTNVPCERSKLSKNHSKEQL